MLDRLKSLTKNQRAVIGLGLALVLLFAVNIFSNVMLKPYQLDLTEGKLFTVSQGTKTIIKGIDEPIVLRLFFTKAMGEGNPQHTQLFLHVKELLERYASLAKGRIRLQLYDAAPFSPAEDKAEAFGLTGIAYNESGDLGYFGLVGTNSTDDVELVKSFTVQRERFLEYDISKLIYRLTNPKKKVIGLISSMPIGGAGPIPNQEGPRWPIIDRVRQSFKIEPLPSYIDKIPDDVDVLWIVHPRKFDKSALYAIDQFVMRGGHVLVFVDPLFESSAKLGPNISPERSNLDRLLNAWGVSLVPGKVAGDLDAARRVRVRNKEGRTVIADYVGWLTLTPRNFDLSDVVTSDIKTLNMGTAGILEPLKRPGVKVTPLITTGPRSMEINERKFEGQPDVVGLFRNFQPDNRRLILAARSTGLAKTAFPEGPPEIKVTPPSGKAAAKSKPSSSDETPQLMQAKKPIDVITVADVDMLYDEFWADIKNKDDQQTVVATADNADFVINALDNLTGSNALAELRGRTATSHPFYMIQRIRQDAERKFRQKEKELENRLKQSRSQMEAMLDRDTRDNSATLSRAQREQLSAFRKKMLHVRRELRDVQRSLRIDLERLDVWLKFLNIAAIPLLLIVGVLLVSLYRRMRSGPVKRGE